MVQSCLESYESIQDRISVTSDLALVSEIHHSPLDLLIDRGWPFVVFFIQQVGCVYHPEEHRAQSRPDLGVGPMLAEDVNEIEAPRDVLKVHDAISNGFPSEVVGQCVMPFLQWGMWDSAACDN